MKKSTRVCKGQTCWYCGNAAFESGGGACKVCGATQDNVPKLGPPIIYIDTNDVDGRLIYRPMHSLVKRIQEEREAAAEK